MLASPDRPSTGSFTRSINKHNNDTVAFADWIEGGAFVAGDISFPDVVDVLMENLVYEDEDLAWNFVSNVQTEIRRRAKHLGEAYPFHHDRDLELSHSSMSSCGSAYVFCLMLSLPTHFKAWADANVLPNGPHRSLFENLTEEACRKFLPSWTIRAFGWSPTSPLKKGQIVIDVAEALHAEVIDAAGLQNANDAGIDILCHRPFSDGWGGYPSLMLQCATGLTNYRDKAVEPNLGLWRDAVRLRNLPKRALAVPFTLGQEDVWQLTAASDGTVLDRIRLISCLSDAVLPSSLQTSIDAWIALAGATLPRAM